MCVIGWQRCARCRCQYDISLRKYPASLNLFHPLIVTLHKFISIKPFKIFVKKIWIAEPTLWLLQNIMVFWFLDCKGTSFFLYCFSSLIYGVKNGCDSFWKLNTFIKTHFCWLFSWRKIFWRIFSVIWWVGWERAILVGSAWAACD